MDNAQTSQCLGFCDIGICHECCPLPGFIGGITLKGWNFLKTLTITYFVVAVLIFALPTS